MPKTARIYVSTQAQIASILGVTTRAVQNMQADGMPGKQDDGYDIASCVQWYLEKKKDSDVNERKKLAEAIDKEKAAALKDLDIQQKSGNLVAVDSTVRFLSREYARVKRKLLSFSSTIAPIIPEDLRGTVISEWDNSIRILLRELSCIEDVDLKELS